MYYLNSRYYDPEVGRFISADGEISGVGGDILGYNMYTYCFNNPVNLDDSTGNWPKWAKKLAAAVAVVAVVATVAAVTVATAGLGTTAACIAIGAAKGAAIGFATGAVTGAITGAVTHRVKNGSWKGAGQAALEGGASGALSGAVTGAITGGINNKVKGLCFVAGTSVLISVGYVVIEDISVGDKVWSENPETGEKELKEVVQTFVNKTDELVHVHVNGEEIITTPEHPFYVPKKGWVGAIHLRAGDILVLRSGEYVVVELIQHEILERPVTVYNFEVEDFHTYYVSNSAILVHNACGEHGIGGKGWVGDKTWRENVKIVSEGGTITSLKGGIPTESQALKLINQAGGVKVRTDPAHLFPNPHTYKHINYLTQSGMKGTIRILE